MRLITAILLSICAGAAGAQPVVTLAEGAPKVLRGATWYKLVPGIALEDDDIVTVAPKQQVQLEWAGGSTVNITGEATVVVSIAKDGAVALTLPTGFAKTVAKKPPVQLDMAQFDVVATDGIFVARADPTEVFIEAGTARIVEGKSQPRDAKRGEFWVRSGNALATRPLAPRPFVDALPRNYIDPLPSLASRIKSKPALAADHDITYEEAAPWLAGKERATFERRFAVRLRDPTFRRAVAPHAARYPMWDRILNPEKYAPKTDDGKATAKEAK